ncbi:MAG TPA: serine hydrolase domain-containing protein [Verrucomicrobiae bacterium]|jgi:CubicO group peptidase (beta-lactamase class C family)|nr:serine hydrolase domain-containing protein [Verrucomicrobiae bacterium]
MSFEDPAKHAAIAHAREIILSEVAAKAPGVSVTVAMHGSVVWSEQFGVVNLDPKAPVTSETRFRIGSVSKPLTAAGIGLLVERGLLNLDAPIQKYVPDFPEKEGVITARMLAGHLSGIRHYRGTEAVFNKPYPNLRSGFGIFENDPLESAPGTKYKYCSYGWNLLGGVMEGAAGQDFSSFIHENILQPLNLTNTMPDLASAADEKRTSFYEMGADGKFFVPPQVDLSYGWPSGGYLSTTEDLARFGMAHFQPDFLKPETLKLLWTTQHTNDGAPTNYGIGWFTKPGSFYHGGDSFGGTCALLLVPKFRLVIALATNVGHGIIANAVRRGRIKAEDVKPFLFHKETIVYKLAKPFITT